MAANSIEIGNWYDYPQYYDLLCEDETDRELAFIEAACEKFCAFPVSKLLEPGCGSGRLVRALARRGFEITAIDNNARSLDYLRRRLSRSGRHATLMLADMADFEIQQPVDAAYCLMNTFRHLLTEASAESHLRAVANSLRPGGIYLLGLHVMPWDASDDCTERWKAQRGRTKVTVTLRVLETDRRRRLEHVRISLRVHRNVRPLKLRTDFFLRRYTDRQIRALLARVPELQLVGVYDFWYQLDQPSRLDRNSADVVLVLRKE